MGFRASGPASFASNDPRRHAVLDIFVAGARALGLSDLEYRQVVQLKSAATGVKTQVTQKTA
jgi:hypothetical protein